MRTSVPNRYRSPHPGFFAMTLTKFILENERDESKYFDRPEGRNEVDESRVAFAAMTVDGPGKDA
jgi:hypothetical protein